MTGLSKDGCLASGGSEAPTFKKCRLQLNILASLVLLFFALSGTAQAKPALTDEHIIQQIIQQSIAAYPGNCPCPYNLAVNGSRCGRRSAYSKPGGASPICYPEDVTPEMINRFRR